MIENEDMTLEDWLIFNNLKLTKLEVKVLNCIKGQGSFYEEAACYDDDTKQYYVRNRSCFFGWYIDEDELPGCRGAIASLVKKGILEVVYQEINYELEASYYIKFTPTFDEHDRLVLSEGVLASD